MLGDGRRSSLGADVGKQRRLDGVGGLPLLPGKHVRVDLEGEGNCGVSEAP